jgi:hypothetical protein
MKVAFTILGECVSMKNTRKFVMIGKHGAKRPAFIKSAKCLSYVASSVLQIPASARQMLTGPLRATFRIYYASERPDLDEAILLDILQAKYENVEGPMVEVGDQYVSKKQRQLVRKGVYENDRQVRERHVYHFIDRANPRAEIEIETMTPQQEALLDTTPAVVARDPNEVPF